MHVNWTPLKTKLPEDRRLVWIGHYRSRTVQIGYYNAFTHSLFDKEGTGIAGSHWAPLEKPEPPTALDL